MEELIQADSKVEGNNERRRFRWTGGDDESESMEDEGKMEGQ